MARPRTAPANLTAYYAKITPELHKQLMFLGGAKGLTQRELLETLLSEHLANNPQSKELVAVFMKTH